MNSTEYLIQNLQEIEKKIGYGFKDSQVLMLAFVHRSFVNEHRHVHYHNERLEYLGDSILGFLISEHLYLQLPDTPEGDLSYLRSRLVEASSCVRYIQKLGLESYLLLGKGERINPGRGRESILADLFEAIIGAVFLDGGMEAARVFLFRNFSEEIESILKTPVQNWKALLQDFCQKKFQVAPHYVVLNESGPDHIKIFEIQVMVNNEIMGTGHGSSKKEAQQAAAKMALKRINT